MNFLVRTNPVGVISSSWILHNGVLFRKCCPQSGVSLLQYITQRGLQCSAIVAFKKKDKYGLPVLNPDGSEVVVPKHQGKTPVIPQIHLKDVSGRMLGLKTREEAKLIAKHQKMILVKDDTTRKIPTYRLTIPRTIDEIDELEEHTDDNTATTSSSNSVSSDSDSDKKKDKFVKPSHALKRVMFNSKLGEHDLQVKVRQVKRLLLKGHETVVKVNAFDSNEAPKLKHIFEEFSAIFNQPEKFGTKITQQRLSAQELKFNVVPVEESLIAKAFVSENEKSDVDLDMIDPNDLLNDENISDKFSGSQSEANKKNKTNT